MPHITAEELERMMMRATEPHWGGSMIDDQNTISPRIRFGSVKPKKNSLYDNKQKYLSEITDIDIDKVIPWLETEMATFSVLRKLSNGIIVTTSVGTDIFRDNVSLDDFKLSLRCAKLTLGGISGREFSLDSDTIVTPDHLYPTLFACGYLDSSYVLQTVNTLDFFDTCNEFYIKNTFKPTTIISSLTHAGDTQTASTVIEWGGVDDRSIWENIRSHHNQGFNILRNYFRRQMQVDVVENRQPNTRVSKYQVKRKGIYVNHEVPFSCEIECYGKDKRTVAEMSRKTPKALGISHDGSLKSDIGFPIELQTPILLGKRGEVFIAETCTTLVVMGFKVDKTCGLHIHLDGGDKLVKIPRSENRRPNELIAMYLFYRVFEPVIESFLPSTRRNNQYCSKFVDGAVHNDSRISVESLPDTCVMMDRVNTIDEFEMYWYKCPSMDHVNKWKNTRYTTSRYFGANFHSLLKDNHFEVRYHSGTLNYEKVLYWIDLHGNILNACSDGIITESMIQSIYNQNLSLEQLTDKMFSLLKANTDTVEYLLERQVKFKDVKGSEEILIDKTKKVGVA